MRTIRRTLGDAPTEESTTPLADPGAESSDRLLFEASPIPAWIIDQDTGRLLAANDAAIRQYGYSLDEFLAMRVDDLRIAATPDQFQGYEWAAGQRATSISGLCYHRRKDGGTLRVRLNTEKLTFAGRPALSMLALDPEPEGSVAALKNRERQLAEAQAMAHVGSWEVDIPTNNGTWSAECYRIFGLPQGVPASYQLFMDRVHPDDRDRVARVIDGAKADRMAPAEFECRVVRPNGEIRFVHNRHVLELDALGHLARVAGTVLDITDRHRVELALAQSERHHRDLIENALDLVTIIDPQGLIQYMSPSVTRLLGYGMEELLGRNVLEFIHGEDHPQVLEAMALDMASPGTPHPAEFRFRHHDGTWRVLEALGQAREQKPGLYTIVVNTRDITLRRLAQDRQQSLMTQLEAAQRGAEAATRAKSEFLANMSHEIRTPMNAVLGLTELLLDTPLSPEQRRHLDMVRNAGDVLLAVLNDILDLSKIEANHLELEAIPLDLPRLVHASANLFALTAPERGLELLVESSANLPHFVRGDPTRLRQVLTNLIGNAIKFTPKGEIVVTAHTEPALEGMATIRFAVRDTGIGIPAEKISTLFKEFSQLDASTTRRYGGTGLGLAIARRLVRLMGGELTVTSEVGRGSEFSFTLALPVESAPADVQPAAPVRLTNVPILVVDDNATNRRILSESLRSAGATVAEAATAAEAHQALGSARRNGRPFAVALLDSQMPDRDGWGLASDIRCDPDHRATHLIMLSSAGHSGETDKCRELSIDGYLVKPVSPSELVEAVGAVLAGRRNGDAVITRHAMTEARNRLRILLAEDNAVNQEVAAAMLRKRGHGVTIVENGLEAVEAVKNGSYDVVLMDLHMPEMDGVVATAEIRKLPGGADLPIIAVTADVLTGERERCLAAGMSGYLAKPFKSHDLFAVVEGWAPSPRPPEPVAREEAPRRPPADIEGFRATLREAGVEGAVEGILETFVAEAPRRISAVVEAIASGDGAEIQSAAHAFKSAAGSIGARELAALLLSIELAGREGNVDAARAHAARFQSESDAVLSYVRECRAGELIHA